MARCGFNWGCGSRSWPEHGPWSYQQKVGAYALYIFERKIFMVGSLLIKYYIYMYIHLRLIKVFITYKPNIIFGDHLQRWNFKKWTIFLGRINGISLFHLVVIVTKIKPGKNLTGEILYQQKTLDLWYGDAIYFNRLISPSCRNCKYYMYLLYYFT